MVDNIKDVFRVIWQYRGSGFLLVLYFIALIYLFITEKDKRNRFLVCYLPLTLLLIYISPVYYRIYVLKLDSHGTYYRNLWMLPVTVTIAYAACGIMRSVSKIPKWIMAVLMCTLLAVCGNFTFSGGAAAEAENAYHIPDYCIELCDAMEQDIPGVNVYACVPLEMLFYVRQYDADICLVYGRDAVEPVWGYYNEIYEAYELAEELDWDKVLGMTRDSSLGTGVVSYFAVPADRKMTADPESFGLEKAAESGKSTREHLLIPLP